MYHTKCKILFLVLLFNSCYCESHENISDSRSQYVRNRNSNLNEILDMGDSGRTLDTLTTLATNLTNSVLQGLNQLIPTAGNSTCPIINLFDPLKIPLYIVFPAVIIGVAILVKKIGFFIAWIPSVTAKWFQSFKSGYEGEEDGGGWGSPSPGYGASVPSSEYGQPGGLTNSRQTAILESIDNLNNQYGHPPGQPAMPMGMNKNNAADYTPEDAQNYMTYYYNQPQVQQKPNYVNSLPPLPVVPVQ